MFSIAGGATSGVELPAMTEAQKPLDHPARVIVITNRIYKQSGLNDLEQLETAPEYDPTEDLNAETIRKYL